MRSVALDRNILSPRAHEGIVVCSDRRLRPVLDALYNNGRRVIVSTAGANVRTASNTIRALTEQGVRRWMVMAHTDTTDISKGCAWAGRLEAEMQAGADRASLSARYIDKADLERFTRLGYTTRSLIEGHNLEVQTASLKALLAGTRAHVQDGVTFDTSTAFADDLLAHVLVITVPSVAKYSSFIGTLNAHGSSSVGRYNTFYLQVSNLEEAIADAKLMTGALHITDVRLLPISKKDHEMMARWKVRLQSEVFMRGTTLTFVAPGGGTGRRRGRRG
jgi:hypothetical protein